MKRAVWLLAASVLLFTDTTTQAQKGPRGRGVSEAEAVKNGWLFSLAEGKAQAARTNKPLMVVVRCVP
jgi:hypothetical protein